MAQAAMVTKAQLERRLGSSVVRRLYDDNNDGAGDPDPILQLCEDGSSKIRGALPLYNPDDLSPANALLTTELRRLSLDAAAAMAAQRIGSGMDWVSLMAQVDADLDRIRKGQASLGSNSNPAPAEHSVAVVSGEPSQGSYWP
jgi:hypothetical protein